MNEFNDSGVNTNLIQYFDNPNPLSGPSLYNNYLSTFVQILGAIKIKGFF